MDRKKTLLAVALIGVFALSIGGVLYVSTKNSEGSTTTKTPYQLYIEAHPEYTKNEAEWLQDLIDGKLSDKKTYVVTFDSDGGSDVVYQVITEGEKAKKPTDPTRSGYTFKEWTYNGSPWIFYGYSVTESLTLKATWNIINYNLTYELDGGEIEEENPSKYNIDSEFVLKSPAKTGYSFQGWFDSSDNKIEKISQGTTGNIDLKAKWSANKNTIQISSNDVNKGTVSIVSGSGYTDENVSIKASALDTYAFRGWYGEDNKLISKDNPYQFVMPPSDVNYHAEFDGIRNLTLSVSDSNKGTVSGAGTKIIGDTIEVSCEVKSGIFKGWFDDEDQLVSSFESFEFVMPSNNYHLTAKFYSNSEESEYLYNVQHGIIPKFNADFTKVTYGMYPQSVVDDADLEASLNALLTTDTPNEFGYYHFDGNYYLKKYISVYNFEQYKSVTDYPKCFDNGEEMLSGSPHWFKVEPIEWSVLEKNESNFTLISTKVLEKGTFDNQGGSRIIDDKTIYENNYEYSSVRNWLNSNLQNKLFFLNTGSNYLVADTEVDNSAKTTGREGNIFACNNTVDKVFLPSLVETKTIKAKLGNCAALTTDYLRSSGAYYNYQTMPYCTEYWTRSPDDGVTGEDLTPAFYDLVQFISEKGEQGRCSASLQHNIRPCITLRVI